MGGRISGTGEDCCETPRRRAEADMPRSLVTARVPGAPPLVALPFALAFAPWGLALGVAAAAVWLACALARRDRVRPGEARRLALRASEAGDSAEALRWLRRARHEEPDDPELAQEEAWHLAALGRVEEALDVYGRLATRLPPGQASWLMATTLFEHGGELDRVEALVADALYASPVFVEELRLEPELRLRLSGRPTFERAWREALRRREER